jgi:hypothetical protein
VHSAGPVSLRTLVNTLTDLLWAIVRWAAPLTVAALIAIAAVGLDKLDDEVCRRVEEKLAGIFPSLAVSVASAELVDGEGILVRGVTLTPSGHLSTSAPLLQVDEVFLSCSTSLADLATADVAIREVELRRPSLRAELLKNGEWNLACLQPHGGDRQIVPITIVDAAIEIHQSGQRTVLRDLELRFHPDSLRPAGTGPSATGEGERWLTVQVATEGDAFGRLQVDGHVRLSDLAFEVTGKATAVALSEQLWSILPSTWLEQLLAEASPAFQVTRAVRGQVEVSFRAAGSLQDPPRIEVSAEGGLRAGRLEHASLPFPITDITASFHIDRSGASCKAFSARAGATSIRGSGRLEGWTSSADYELLLEAERLHVGRHWEPVLPEDIAAHYRKLMPAGEVDVRAHIVRHQTEIQPSISVRCRNLSITHYRFPYRLDRTVGTVVLEDDRLTMHLTGQAGGHAVHVNGSFTSPGPDARGVVEVRGDGMRLDDALIAAMPRRSADIVRSLHASGTFDFAFRHQRSPDLPEGHANQLGIRLTDCQLAYALFPYPLTQVTGQVLMQDGHWTISNCVGRNDTGTVHCSGELVPRQGEDGELTLTFSGSQVVLENELRDALPMGMRRIWDDLSPRGAIDLTAVVRHQVRARTTSVELHADPHGETVSIEPSWFPYRLEKLGGRLHWHDGVLTFRDVRAAHDRTAVAASGTCRFTPDGGWHVSFERLAADRFRVDHDLLQALPVGLHEAIAAVRPRGLLSLDGSLDVYSTRGAGQAANGPAAAAWDMWLDMEQGGLDAGFQVTNIHGGMRLAGRSDGRLWQASGDLLIDSAMYRGMQVRKIQGPLAMDSHGVRFGSFTAVAGQSPRRITAELAEGQLAMDGGVTTDGEFRVAVGLESASVERLVADLTGAATAYRGTLEGTLELAGTGSARHSLTGRGHLRLEDADLYELPLIVALLKVIRVKAPDRTAFDSSIADFRVEGPHVYLDAVELSGDAVSLVGNGEIDFDSNVHLTFRSIMGDSQSQLPVMKRMLGGASGQFMLIHVDGTLAHPDMTSEAFPTLNALVQQFQSQGLIGQDREREVNTATRTDPRSWR